MKNTSVPKSVLIVEDDAYIGEVVLELLRMENIPSQLALNGRIALDILNSGSQLPSLILLDLMMPVMDGFSFRAEQMANPALAQIPVVVMSADGNLLKHKSRISAAAFLKKPMDIDALIKVVRENT